MATASLSGIPAELRVKIFELLLAHFTVEQSPDNTIPYTRIHSTTYNSLAILQVSRLFRQEALPLATDNIPIKVLLRRPRHGGIARIDLPAHKFVHIEHVVTEIQPEDFDGHHGNFNIKPTLQACPNLQTLELRGHLIPFHVAGYLMRPILRRNDPATTLQPNAASIHRFKTLFLDARYYNGLIGQNTNATVTMPCVLVNHRGAPWMRPNGSTVVGVSTACSPGSIPFLTTCHSGSSGIATAFASIICLKSSWGAEGTCWGVFVELAVAARWRQRWEPRWRQQRP